MSSGFPSPASSEGEEPKEDLRRKAGLGLQIRKEQGSRGPESLTTAPSRDVIHETHTKPDVGRADSPAALPDRRLPLPTAGSEKSYRGF